MFVYIVTREYWVEEENAAFYKQDVLSVFGEVESAMRFCEEVVGELYPMKYSAYDHTATTNISGYTVASYIHWDGKRILDSFHIRSQKVK